MKPKRSSEKTTDALKIIDRAVEGKPDIPGLLAEARMNLAVAQMLYDGRIKAGLSQAELARRVGTTQSVISRLEDADYQGHSLTMLQKIAAALGRNLQFQFGPVKQKPKRKTSRLSAIA